MRVIKHHLIVIAIICTVAVIIFFTAAYLFLLSQGKNLVVSQLKNLTQREVNIEHFRVIPPLDIQIGGLEISGMANIKSLFISPSPVRLLFGRLAFNQVRIRGAEFTYEKKASAPADNSSGALESITQGAGAAITAAAPAPPVDTNKNLSDFLIRRITIKDATLHFIDHTAGETGITITVKDIYLNMTNLSLRPHRAIINFDLSGRIPWGAASTQPYGKIDLEGWINLYKRNMEAVLKISDIDGIYFYPYYSKWVDLEKARIQSAKLNFNCDIHGLNNLATVHYKLELTDLMFKPRSPEEQQDKAEKIAHAVIGVFKALNQNKIVLEHTFQTPMDRPQFGFGLIKSAVEDKFQTASSRKQSGLSAIGMFPAKILEGTVRGATDLTTSVITGTIRAGGEIGKAVGDVFKKKTDEKKE